MAIRFLSYFLLLTTRISVKFASLDSYSLPILHSSGLTYYSRSTDTDSSFTQDLTRMAWITRYIHPQSLILVDEFGKGTAPQGEWPHFILPINNTMLIIVYRWNCLISRISSPFACSSSSQLVFPTDYPFLRLSQARLWIHIVCLARRIASRSRRIDRGQTNRGSSRSDKYERESNSPLSSKGWNLPGFLRCAMCWTHWFATDHHRESKGGSLSARRWSLDITVHSPECWDSSPPRFDDDKQPRKDGRHPTRPFQRTGLEKGVQGGTGDLSSEDCLIVNEHSHC